MLEIGFGTGDYLIRLAKSRPDYNVLGIEISLPSLRRGLKKMQRSGLSNLRLLQADSQTAIWLLLKRESIGEIVINFPDPWPKASHHHRRLLSERFLTLLGTRAMSGSRLDIATDHGEYAAEIRRNLESSAHFDNRLSAPYLSSDIPILHTKYEMKAISEGRTCYYFKYRRNSNTILEAFPILEERPLPHIVLKCPLPLNELRLEFRPFEIDHGDIHIKYLDLYQSTQEDTLLAEVYVTEEPYHQHVCLAVRIRSAGDMVLSLHSVGFPRPTPGIHLAIHYLFEWIVTFDQDVSIITSTLKISSRNAI